MITVANARICTPTLLEGWLQIEHGHITALGPGEPPHDAGRPLVTPARDAGSAGVTGGEVEPGQGVVDAGGRWVLPGFVDTHCHGGGGAALYSGNTDDVIQAASTHLAQGTTTLIASVATMRLDRMLAAATAIARAVATNQAPNIRGIHFEGPFLSPKRRGAQTESALLTPDEQVFADLIDAADGLAVSMTIAPELPGAIDLIHRHHEQITFAVGHTDDDGSHTRQAFDAGARTATHLFNAMPTMTHRHPGPVGVALLDDRVACELIADGTHLSPEALTVATRTAGPDRSILVTDAMAATGLGDGDYSYADRHVTVHHGIAKLRGTGTLAGSVHFLSDALANVVRLLHLTPPQAAPLVSTNAARQYGWRDRGTIAIGRSADLVLLSEDLTVHTVYLAGKPFDR
ncbi:N-acetylglucosamine-6-phosphate deacetylase [Kribbella sp. NBC_00889]|uniref:N-acetylglucosamine-6-phosphate deacetylase n=1 Tax=Kribbella sp. NBC_00889 TaxID=2975974 RepID=UPI00386C38D8|nr:N-acetylglucosamine-6-phosphate deacetylase [Kribbella sp. NBC_00889]